jgi:hypothetical protein
MKIDLNKHSVRTRYHVDDINMETYQIEITQMANSGNITVLVEKWRDGKYKTVSIQRFNKKALNAAKAHARDIITLDMIAN